MFTSAVLRCQRPPTPPHKDPKGIPERDTLCSHDLREGSMTGIQSEARFFLVCIQPAVTQICE